MSRRASSFLVLLGAIACSAAAWLPASASATPTVTFKARAVPIPGFRHTGNILGAGAALQVQYTIAGTEYGGFPPPLIGVNFYTPAGTAIYSWREILNLSSGSFGGTMASDHNPLYAHLVIPY